MDTESIWIDGLVAGRETRARRGARPAARRRDADSVVRRVVLAVAVMLLLAAAFAGAGDVVDLSFEPPAEPDLTGGLRRWSLEVGGLERTAHVYVPSPRPERPWLAVALHGAGGTGSRIRVLTGYGLDRIADHHGGVVVYPDGVGRTWNGCRPATPYPSNRRDIDDLGFLAAIVARAAADLGADPVAAFGLGFSNGGHMLLRVAAEAPNLLAAVTVVGATPPRPASSDCPPFGRGPAVQLVTGTDDPVNPLGGGAVRNLKGDFLADVPPAGDAAAALAAAVGHGGQAEIVRTGAIERRTWRSAGAPETALVVVHGGGHAVPQPWVTFPEAVGRTEHGFDTPLEAWRHFVRANGDDVSGPE